MITYTKAAVDDPAIITLAKEMDVPPKEVCAIINQQRYRAAYNRQQQVRMKVVRRLVKEHPELMKEVDGAK